MERPMFSQLFGSNINMQDTSQGNNLTDAQMQRRRLTTAIADLEKDEKKEQTAVVYDPVLRISQVFKLGQNGKKDEKQEREKKQESFIKFIGKVLSCSCTENKYKGSYQMITVLFDSLKAEQSSWLERHYNRYSRDELDQLKQQHVTKMIKALSRIKAEIQNDKVDRQNQQSAMSCILQLEKTYNSIEPKKHRLFNFILRKQNHYIFMIMISAFCAFSKNYTTYQRMKLKRLFDELQISSKSVQNSIEVLRFLENKDSLVAELQPLEQKQIDELVDLWIYDYLRINKVQSVNTKIGLVRVSDSSKRRRVVNLLISGFLSEDKDKRQQWNQLLACMPDSEVYGLQWESNTITKLVMFLVSSIKDIVLGKDLDELFTKDNPFIPAFQVSIQAGEMLAYVVHKIFPFQFVNIIGYSLGSQLIRAFVKKSIELNGGKNINKVISMGGVSDINQFQDTLKKSQQTISVLNCRSKRDSILKYVLKRAKPNIKPLGLNDLNESLQNHFIKNIDVSKQINGHFAFMTNFGTIAELLKLNEE